jgi:hypothetical protein
MTQPVPTYSPASPASRTFKSLVPVPTIVNVAFWILVAGSALTAVLLILSALGLAGVRPSVALPASAIAVVAVTLIGGGIGLLIRIGTAVMLRRGYGPARIFLTVVSVYSIGVGALNGLDPIGVLQLAGVVIPVILVWLPAASRYFSTVRQARRQAKAAGMTVGFLG